jgi:hypothetical protein
MSPNVLMSFTDVWGLRTPDSIFNQESHFYTRTPTHPLFFYYGICAGKKLQQKPYYLTDTICKYSRHL